MASSMKSLSQLSLSHQKSSTKKKKSSQNTNSSNNQVDNNSDNINFTFNKSSKYLRMPRKLLLHSLRLQLNHPIKKKKETRFILTRLQLLDHQFCLDRIRYLYQSYYDQGMKFQMWPENILKIVQSTEYSVIQKYFEDYLVLFQGQIDQHKNELASQSLTFPSTLSSLDTIDIRLNEFVRLHHIDLIRTVQYRVNKFKDDIHEKELFKRLSYYYLNTNQFETITRLTTIRKQQMSLFEKLTMFEQRILCRQLPKSLDSILPKIDTTKLTNKHYKMLQELKRVTLNVKFQEYEEEIQHYEDLYQQEFISLQEQIQNPSSSDHKHQTDILMYSLQLYLNHYAQKMMRQIRFKEACLRVKLTRHHRRQQSLLQKNIIDVYPQVIIDVPKISMNRVQLEYLSKNGK
uniref:Uncharacterized protein n=1 Tax=Adineta vaga TaxID=104782 RepID=A5HC82_ADIVA|nr:hypothetical protein [Adineta vaga]ABQ08081.1 hypothetical protein [Adineta vaga]